MNGEVDVSVVLVTYNHERYIVQAIESVLAQRFSGSIELLITEDRSTDRTRNIVEEYARIHPELITLFLSERNRNDNEVIARAHRAARGEFIAYLDGDDYWFPDKLERQVAHLRADSTSPLSFHGVQIVDATGVTGERWTHSNGPVVLSDLLLRNPVHAPSVCFRRALLPDPPVWLNDLPVSDWPIAMLLAQHGPIRYLDATLSAYRVHAEGLWSKADAVTRRRWDLAVLNATVPRLSGVASPDAALALAYARARLMRALLASGSRRAASAQLLALARLVQSFEGLTARERLVLPGRLLAVMMRRRGASFKGTFGHLLFPGRHRQAASCSSPATKLR